MKKSIPRYVWIICLIVTILILVIGIPISVYNIYPVELSIFGGILIGLFLIFYLLYENGEKNNDGDEITEKEKRAISIGVIVMFVSGFLFFEVFDTKVSYRLKDGIKTSGIVVNLEAETNHRKQKWWRKKSKSYYATVVFQTTEGVSVEVTENLDFEDYSNLRNGSKVNLLYSKKDPKIAALMISANTIKKYTVTAERIILLSDLLTLTDKPSTEIEAFLNSISYQWQYNENNRRWENTKRDISVAAGEGAPVVYRLPITEGEIIHSELRNNGFVEIADDGKKGKAYHSEKFIATVESEVIKSGGYTNIYKIVTVTKR